MLDAVQESAGGFLAKAEVLNWSACASACLAVDESVHALHGNVEFLCQRGPDFSGGVPDANLSHHRIAHHLVVFRRVFPARQKL